MSSKLPNETEYACPKCQKGGFKTASAVRAHLLAKGHDLHCTICNTHLPTVKSVMAHHNYHQKRTNSVNPSQAGQTRSTPPASKLAIHRHVTLQVQEQDLIFQELWARCHSARLLSAEGYKLGPSVEKRTQERRADEKKRPLSVPVIPATSFLPTPKQLPNQTQKKRRAVVLDCEMVQVVGNSRELAYLTAVDFLTNEILINNYVQPTREVVHWNTRYSGISYTDMNRACAEGRALRGWMQARQVLWDYVDSDTVLIGHSLENDLKVLGFYHSKIVDSQILTSQAVRILLPPDEHLTRRWGLKLLTKELLEDDIQVGKNGHSALEDTRATRDVVIWCIRNPELLKVWAMKSRVEEERRLMEGKRRNEERRKEAEKKKQAEAERKLKAAKG